MWVGASEPGNSASLRYFANTQILLAMKAIAIAYEYHCQHMNINAMRSM
jgi:hypothetical protein